MRPVRQRKKHEMFTSLIFATFVLTVTSLNTGYKEDFFEVHGEYDKDRNEYLNLRNLPKDIDIWDENTKDSSKSVIPEERLRVLCENFDLAVGDHLINCKDLKLIRKSLKIHDSHVIQKRQAEQEESLDEGSGDGEEHSAVEEHPVQSEKISHETASVHSELVNVATEHAEKLFEYQSANVVDINTVDAEKGDTSKHAEKNAEIKILPEEISLEHKPLEKHQEGQNAEHKPEEKPAEESSLSKISSVQNAIAEKPAEEKTVEEKPSEEKIEKGKPSEKKLAEEKPAEAELAKEKPIDEKPAEVKPVAEKTVEAKLTEQKSIEEKPAEEKSIEEKLAEEKSVEEKPSEEKVEKGKPSEEKLAEEKPAGNELAKEKPIDEKLAEVKPVADKTVEAKLLTEEKSIEEKPAEEKSDVEKPDENKSSEEKKIDDKISEDKLTEDKPVAEKTTEKEPVVEKPAENKASEEKKIDDKLTEDKPITGKPIEKERVSELATEATVHSSHKPESEHKTKSIAEEKPVIPIGTQKPIAEEHPKEEKNLKAVEKPVEKPVIEIAGSPETSINPVSQQTKTFKPSTGAPQPGSAEPKESEKDIKDLTDKPIEEVNIHKEVNVNLQHKPNLDKSDEQKAPGNDDKKGRKFQHDGKEAPDIATASMGEAKESVSQKDTKILIGLFTSVIGVGAAAFAYNHYRKKKRANASRTSTNGVNRNDPEEGREMKPLMTEDGGKRQSVEYKDERHDKTEEVRS